MKSDLKIKEDLNKKTNKLSSYVIFPNPTFNEVGIKGKTENEQIEIRITDVLGREVISKKVIINNFNAKVKFDLNVGVYFVRIFTKEGKTAIQKLIIKD